jgi:hypothetical protein
MAMPPPTQAAEHRYHDHGHLVRIYPIRCDIPILERRHLPFETRTVYLLRVMVYFAQPLTIDVHVVRKRWTTTLAQVSGLCRDHAILTGHHAFDRHFLIHGQPSQAVQRLLAPPFPQTLVAFMRQRRRRGIRVREVDLSRVCLTYTEGPYARGEMAQLMPQAAPIVEELLTLVSLLEAAQA